MRNATRALLVVALFLGVAGGCHKKKGGGYFAPAPVPAQTP